MAPAGSQGLAQCHEPFDRAPAGLGRRVAAPVGDLLGEVLGAHGKDVTRCRIGEVGQDPPGAPGQIRSGIGQVLGEVERGPGAAPTVREGRRKAHQRQGPKPVARARRFEDQAVRVLRCRGRIEQAHPGTVPGAGVRWHRTRCEGYGRTRTPAKRRCP